MKNVLGWILPVTVLLLLIGSLYYIDYSNSMLKEELKNEHMSLRQYPVDTLEQITMEAELTRRRDDIEKIKSYIVERDQLVHVIAHVEEKAEIRDIVVEVPSIEERVLIDPVTGAEIPPSGLFQDLEVEMQATGDPDNIVNFLHDLEHSPYMVQLPSWRVSSDASTVSVTSGASAAPEGSEVVEQASGRATIKAIVTIWRSEDISN